jgi:hypothetical protein
MRWLTFTRNQKDHLLQWVIITAIVELVLIAFPGLAWGIFLVGGVAFLVGFVLRTFHGYPGKDEPLLLDLLSGVPALAGGVGCLVLGTSPLVVILRIATPPLAIVPHFIYIICNRDLGPCGYRRRKAPQNKHAC